MGSEPITANKSLHLPSGFNDLPDGWSWSRLDDVCEGVFDCPHSTPKLVETGPFVVRTQDIVTGIFRTEQAAHVSEETYKERTSRVVPTRGDVLYSREGTYFGIAAEVPENTHVCLGQRMVLMRPKAGLLSFRFLRYWLNSPIMASHIHGYRDGTVAERLNLPTIRALPILRPPLSEQRAITQLLITLDDKMELIRRMNTTLEAMARALFQSWFVDFDPVRAKLDDRSPIGLDSATSVLFPTHFQDSPLGPIPKGWTTESVGEVIACVGGATPSTTEAKFWEGGTHHWTTPKDFSSLQASVLLDTARKITDIGVSNISSGLLPAGTVLLSSRAPVGYLAIAAMPVAINQGFIAMKCNERASNFFMLNWCRANMAEIESRATGTTFAEISKQNFRPIPMVLPPKELMAAFTSKVAPFYAQITANLRQSRSLATLRDTLIPKLLSGELRVGQMEQTTPNIVPFPVQASKSPSKKTTDEFVEAVVIAQLVRKLATSEHPLGRKRYNKFAYLAHRKADEDVTQHYLKKAAGPYSPWAKYGGPEKIAEKNGYVEQGKAGVFTGLVVGKKIEDIDRYLSNYPVCAAIDWIVDKFRFKKNDDLELLATVDFAALDLLREGKPLNRETIKQVIAANKEWAPKLDRAVFSDLNVDRALAELATLFPATYQC
jgi:type I restriction enzyme S subunit